MTLYPFLIGSGGFNSVIATGGTISDVTISGKLWRRHAFTSPGGNQFVITNAGQYGTVDVLMWAGGGGGGAGTGGGGGGGAYVRNSNLSINVETLNISVGGGSDIVTGKQIGRAHY